MNGEPANNGRTNWNGRFVFTLYWSIKNLLRSFLSRASTIDANSISNIGSSWKMDFFRTGPLDCVPCHGHNVVLLMTSIHTSCIPQRKWEKERGKQQFYSTTKWPNRFQICALVQGKRINLVGFPFMQHVAFMSDKIYKLVHVYPFESQSKGETKSVLIT